jgi:hypothetical protein
MAAATAPDPVVPVALVDPVVPDNAKTTSRAVWNRSVGFFSSACCTMRSSAGGRSARWSGGGSSRRIAVMTSAEESSV